MAATGIGAVQLSAVARVSVSNASGAHPVLLSTAALSKRNNSLGMPPYVTDIWANFGWAEARRRVELQRDNADTSAAWVYYTAVVAAMTAIQDGHVAPAVPPALGPQTDIRLYAPSIMLSPLLRAQGKVSLPAQTRAAWALQATGSAH